MIHRLNVFLLSLIVTFAPVYFTTAHASAAEKWNYEPVMKDMNIHVKGYKVDQYGNAVNDYEYNTKIDPKTTANRKKMGTVGFGRLLKTTGWGLLGSAALEALLNSVDWILDPEAQSIWRNKPNPNPSYQCKNDGFSWKSIYSTATCPSTVAENSLEPFCLANGGASPDITCKYLDLFVVTPTGAYVPAQQWTGDVSRYAALYGVTNRHGSYSNYVIITKDKELPKTEPEKEYLTPEQLADYVNKTHPDYAKPELAEKLNPKYSPKIVEDLWKPSNQWEEVNSPTVQEVQKKLDQAQPEPKKDAEIKPNPETGGSILPKFCDWASPVCDAIKWFKETPDLQDEPLNIEDKQVIDYEHINYVQFGASCPFSPQAQSLPMGVLGSIDFETDLTFICSFGVEAKPYIVGLGHLGALIFLLIGIRNGNG